MIKNSILKLFTFLQLTVHLIEFGLVFESRKAYLNIHMSVVVPHLSINLKQSICKLITTWELYGTKINCYSIVSQTFQKPACITRICRESPSCVVTWCRRHRFRLVLKNKWLVMNFRTRICSSDIWYPPPVRHPVVKLFPCVRFPSTVSPDNIHTFSFLIITPS